MPARIPRHVWDISLANSCGLVAAAAHRYLTDHHVRAKILNIRYGPTDGHTITVFKSAGRRLCSFDSDGSMTYTPDANWRTDPVLLAKAWVKANKIGKRVTGAKWI
jgi:hypothetical protein